MLSLCGKFRFSFSLEVYTRMVFLREHIETDRCHAHNEEQNEGSEISINNDIIVQYCTPDIDNVQTTVQFTCQCTYS